jgi:CHAT domain-containing protein
MMIPGVSEKPSSSHACSMRWSTRVLIMASLHHQIWLVLLFISLSAVFPAAQAVADSSGLAKVEMEQGNRAFRQGAVSQAAVRWTEAARLYEGDGKVREQSQALINLGQAFQHLGQYKKGALTFQVALKLSEEQGDRRRVATVLGHLGNVGLALGRPDHAMDYLAKAMTIAKEDDRSELMAILLNDLGNVFASQNRTFEAIDTYGESYDRARTTGQASLAVTALINQAGAEFQEERYVEAKNALDTATQELQGLQDTHEKASALVSIGIAYDDLRLRLTPPRMIAKLDPEAIQGSRGARIIPGRQPDSRPSSAKESAMRDKLSMTPRAPKSKSLSTAPSNSPVLPPSDETLYRQASQSFASAATIAVALGDWRVESYARGYSGYLLEKERHFEQALEETRKAIFAAQKGNAPESLYRWHWQTGRLLKALGNEDDALSAYRRAVHILQPIRYEFSVGYQSRRHSFRDSVGPLFSELADMLLQRAGVNKDPAQYQALLVQARDTTEAFRAAELQDYFQDECVKTAATRKSLDKVSHATAVVYPIILPERLELLVNFPDGLKRFPIDVRADLLTHEVRMFRKNLQDRTSQNYLPHAQQLYDWLMRPLERELATQGIKTVVFVPDGPLRTIPMAALHDGEQYVIKKYALAVTPGMELTDARPINRARINLLAMGLTEAVQGFPALPNVGTELSAVKGLFKGKQLVDKQFLVPTMEREMKEEQFNVVHIASHGLVENDVSNSYVLAYDDKITMDRLAQLIGMFKYRNSPLELLTLSACETAVGDDRAALGLAGVAIKAGARSALATLWFIDDQATSQLVAEFYSQLRDPLISKAVALQRAQVKTLSNPDHQHPSYWAPFLLINNWL